MQRPPFPPPPLSPRAAQDVQRALALLASIRHAVEQELDRMAAVEQTLLRLIDGPVPLAEPLTPRERDVLRLIAEGYSEREIAEQLHLRKGTPGSYMRHIRAKLGVRNRIEAVLKAWQLGQI